MNDDLETKTRTSTSQRFTLLRENWTYCENWTYSESVPELLETFNDYTRILEC